MPNRSHGGTWRWTCPLRRMSTRRSTRQDDQINYLSTLSIFMKQTTYLATLPNPDLKANAPRYVLALREGGSLPAIVEAEDFGLYLVKFRGAGQGPLALVAELVAGEIGRALGLRVPELVFLQIDAAPGRNG